MPMPPNDMVKVSKLNLGVLNSKTYTLLSFIKFREWQDVRVIETQMPQTQRHRTRVSPAPSMHPLCQGKEPRVEKSHRQEL